MCNAQEDEHSRQQARLIRALLMTTQHYFGGFQRMFAGVTDPRHLAYITYTLPSVLVTGMLMFLFRLGARRQVNLMLRHNGPSSAKFEILFATDTCPHGDTIDESYKRLDVSEVQEVVTGTVETLIRKKVLYRYRLRGRYYLVSIDGTGVHNFPERHCPYCLTTTRNGCPTYHHPILEAKLVTCDGFVFSLMTEFIENPGPHPTKQDCELKAFYRLAARLKCRFPRLPICLLLDGLYAGGPTFSICEKHRWKYMIVLPEDNLPSVQEEFNSLLAFFPENRIRSRVSDLYKTSQDFVWVNDIEYVDSQNHDHSVAVIRCLETKPDSQKQLKTTRFKWITNFHVKNTNVIELSNQGGRLRWKIENEGFNVQKNGGFALEHAYTRHPVSAKVFYLLLQLAHTLAQLIERGSLLCHAFPAGVGSAKNLAWHLLEAWRNARLTAHQIQLLLTPRIQIRLKPP